MRMLFGNKPYQSDNNYILKTIYMKKTFLCLLAVCLSLTACHKAEDSSEEAEIIGVNPENPTDEDIVKQTFSLKTFVYPEATDNSEFGKAIARRCVSLTSENITDADMVIISDIQVPDRSEEEISDIARMLYNNGALVYLMPTAANFTSFVHSIQTCQDRLISLGELQICPAFSTIDCLDYNSGTFMEMEGKDVFARAICICNNGVNTVMSAGDYQVDTYCYELNEETGEITEIPVEGKPDSKVEETAAECGMLAEMLCEWIESESQKAANETGTNSEPYVKDFDFSGTLHYMASDACDHFDPSNLHRYIPYKIAYTYWPVYVVGNDEDHYLMTRKVWIQGSQLDPGPSEIHTWWGNNRDRGEFYGPYLSNVRTLSTCNQIQDLIDYKPKNNFTRTSYLETVQMNLGGGVTIGTNPSVNIGGSYNKSTSVGTTAMDLSLNVTLLSLLNPEYAYSATNRPSTHWSWPRVYHDTAVMNYHQDLSFESGWIWRVRNAKSKSNTPYRVDDKTAITIQMLGCRVVPFYTYADYYDKVFTLNNWQDLMKLPHFDQLWGTEVVRKGSPIDPQEVERLEKFVEERYSEFWSKKLFHVYCDSETDTKNIENFRNRFIDVLKNDQQIWINHGFTGTFTFTWRLNKDRNKYYEYDFTVNP